MNDRERLEALMVAVHSTMPTPRPWEDDPNHADDLLVAMSWLYWLPKLTAHQVASTIRANAAHDQRQPGGRRQTAAAIRKHADEVDPFFRHDERCNVCGPAAAAKLGEHYHLKSDKRLVPAEVLKGIH